jgi:Domain of unknown function (DUF4189)
MKVKTLCLLLCACPVISVHAENGCPAGFLPWRVPIESANDCVAISEDSEEEARLTSNTPAAPKWVSRWGAIAIGSTAGGGGVGAVADQGNRRKAESAAVKRCRDTGGGKRCELFTYYDECAAVAWGSRAYAIRSAASVELASRAALDYCAGLTDGCRIFYTACSLPKPVR